MSISTSLLFSRAVDLMARQQSSLASLQEKVATGKELVRPSDSPDLAVNVSRIKASIDEMDAYKNSLNAVNDRLTIEESYLEGSKDVLIRLKQLVLQGSNATLTGKDREVVAIEVDELISEMQNLANGTDANGNYLFGGSRVTSMPYAKDEDGIIRYQGDNFRPNIDYSSSRRSPIGRNGLDVFKPVLSGEFVEPRAGQYQLAISGNIEVGDQYTVLIDGQSFGYEVRPGDTQDRVLSRLAFAINESVLSGELQNIETEVSSEGISLIATDGVARTIAMGTKNASDGIDDLASESALDPDSGKIRLSLSGTMEPGDRVTVRMGLRVFDYAIRGNEGGLSPTTPEAVMASLVDAANQSGLFTGMGDIAIDPDIGSTMMITPIANKLGTVELELNERTNVNDQAAVVTLISEPRPALPERVEFFESLQQVAAVLRHGSQDDIQAKLSHLDQMLDIVTLSMADIGAEMSSLDNEIAINEDLKLQLQSALSGAEDVDYAAAITELQAKMMSLEAAQSSFAKISQLSVFDYIR